MDWWPESDAETVIYGVIFVMALGCGGGGGVELMPHLSGWGSSEARCNPDQNECPNGNEVCVYNPYIVDDGAEIDLNGYDAWIGSECGEAPDDEGICVERPAPDDGDYHRPVCSCDRTTYENPSAAHADGASIDYYGECRQLLPHIEEGSSLDLCDLGAGECPASEECLLEPFKRVNGEYPTTKCLESDGDTTRVEAGTYSNGYGDEDFRPGGHGFCVSVESGASTGSYPGDEDPVCGCDGETYPSNAAAHAAGTSVAKQAACDESSGQFCRPGAISCPPSEYCEADGDRPCEDSGECVAPPSECPSGESKVCGCDGVTYRNTCVAHREGVPVAGEGACTTMSGEIGDERLQPPEYDLPADDGEER